jgi:DNA-binding MarR family transcriptional regulator
MGTSPRPAGDDAAVGEDAAVEAREAMAGLRRAVNDFLASEGRLRSRYQRLGRLLPPAGLGGLVKLLSEDELTSSQLARASARSPAAMSEQLERLEARGIVSRRRDDRDGRVVWVSLTPRGRKEVAAMRADWDQLFHEAFADTSDEELEVASEVLRRLVDLFDSLGSSGEA